MFFKIGDLPNVVSHKWFQRCRAFDANGTNEAGRKLELGGYQPGNWMTNEDGKRDMI